MYKNRHRSFAFLALLASVFAAPLALGVVAPEGGAAPDPATPPAPAADAPPAPTAPRPGVSARLAGAMASLAGGLPATVAAEMATTRKDLTQARADLTATKASLKSTETALASVCGFLGLSPADLVGKSDTDIDALCTARLTAAATSQLAQRGFSPGQLPASTGGNGDEKRKTKAEFDAMSASEKSKFSVAGGRIVEA